MRPGTAPGAGGVTLDHDRLDLGGVDLAGLSREDVLAALTDAALEAFDELGPADFADRPPLRPVRFTPWAADAEFAFDPSEARDEAGKWAAGGGGGTKSERSAARVARKREERAAARQARGEARHLNGILRDRARDIARAHGLLPESLPTPALDRAVAALSPAPGVPTPLHGQPLREKLAAFERVRDEAGREIEVTESLNRLVPRREDADALERLREVSHHAARAADHLSHTLWERESRFSADFAGDDPSGHWVTLEEGEHVFIHEGKVYATREAIEHLARGRPPPDTPAPHHPLRPAPGGGAGGRKGKARGAASPGVGGAARPAAGDFDPHAEAQAIHDLVDRHVAAVHAGAEADEGGRGGGIGRKYPRMDAAHEAARREVEAHVADLVARAPTATALRDVVRAYGLPAARGSKESLAQQLRDVLRQRLGTVGRAYASAEHEPDPSEAHFAGPLRPVRFTPYYPDAEFYSPDQPRDDRGRWTAGGGEGAAPRPTQADRAALRQSSLAAVRAYVRAGGEPTHVEHEQLAAHLARLTVDQLHAVKVEHGLKASGKVKSDLVARLAERFRLHRAKQEPAGRKALAEAVAGREGWHAPRDVMGGHAALHGPTGARVRADSAGTMFDVLTSGSGLHSTHATAGEAVRAAEVSNRFGTGGTTAEREHAARQEAIAKSRERAAKPPGENEESLRRAVQAGTHSLESVRAGKYPVGVEGRGGSDAARARELGMYVNTVNGTTLFARTPEDARPLEEYLRAGGRYGSPEFSRLLGYTSEQIDLYRRYLAASGQSDLLAEKPPAAAPPAPAGGGLPRQGDPHPEEIKEAAGRVFQYPSSKGWWVRDVDPKVGVLPSLFKTKADAVAYAVSNRRAVESRRGADYAPYDSVSRADIERYRAHFAEEDSPESRESDSPDFSAAPAPLRPVRFVPLVQPPPAAEFAPGGQEDARR